MGTFFAFRGKKDKIDSRSQINKNRSTSIQPSEIKGSEYANPQQILEKVNQAINKKNVETTSRNKPFYTERFPPTLTDDEYSDVIAYITKTNFPANRLLGKKALAIQQFSKTNHHDAMCVITLVSICASGSND